MITSLSLCAAIPLWSVQICSSTKKSHFLVAPNRTFFFVLLRVASEQDRRLARFFVAIKHLSNPKSKAEVKHGAPLRFQYIFVPSKWGTTNT